MSPLVKRIAIGAVVVVVGGIGTLAYKMWPRVDEIPEELDPIPETTEVASIELPAQAGMPALRLDDYEGKTVYLTIESQQSAMAGEGTELNRALDRWVMPEDVVGMSIGDAAGMGLFKGKIQEFADMMRPEMSRPLYLDFDGIITEAFAMPKGHLGFIVLGPDGEVAHRHSGPTDEGDLAEIKAALGATDPPPPPPAPAFELEGLSPETCGEGGRGKGCMLVFLSGPVARTDVPGIEGGFDGKRKEGMKRMTQPDLRNVSMLYGWEMKASVAPGALIGKTTDIEIEGWTQVEQAPDVRAAFDIEPDEAAMVIVDQDGGLYFKEVGRIPFWKFGQVGHQLGIEAKMDDKPE